MLFGQCELTIAHTTFGVNLSKLCRDTVSDVLSCQSCPWRLVEGSPVVDMEAVAEGPREGS